ncbi:hypothetical protein [Roseateles sp. MS654]|uniref:hypothetical protein n=1 Tax=Roseateles sp. MS654 TaxID=3412685 RepID=UPI003C2B0002
MHPSNIGAASSFAWNASDLQGAHVEKGLNDLEDQLNLAYRRLQRRPLPEGLKILKERYERTHSCLGQGRRLLQQHMLDPAVSTATGAAMTFLTTQRLLDLPADDPHVAAVCEAELAIKEANRLCNNVPSQLPELSKVVSDFDACLFSTLKNSSAEETQKAVGVLLDALVAQGLLPRPGNRVHAGEPRATVDQIARVSEAVKTALRPRLPKKTMELLESEQWTIEPDSSTHTTRESRKGGHVRPITYVQAHLTRSGNYEVDADLLRLGPESPLWSAVADAVFQVQDPTLRQLPPGLIEYMLHAAANPNPEGLWHPLMGTLSEKDAKLALKEAYEKVQKHEKESVRAEAIKLSPEKHIEYFRKMVTRYLTDPKPLARPLEGYFNAKLGPRVGSEERPGASPPDPGLGRGSSLRPGRARIAVENQAGDSSMSLSTSSISACSSRR